MLTPEDIKIEKIEYQHGVVEFHVLVRKFKSQWFFRKVPSDEFVLYKMPSYDSFEPAKFTSLEKAEYYRKFLLEDYFRSLPAKITEI